jgi:carbamoyltransferase
MAKVLGLSFFFHDSAAALVSDGQIVAAAAEERFSRQKHTNEFPRHAITYCLAAGGLSSINELDAIVFYEKPLRKMIRVVEGMVATWPRSLGGFVQQLPGYLKGKVSIQSVIERELRGYTGPILFSEHHLSHAASAYFCSPFDECAVLTIDGVGEWETTTIGVARGREITLDRAIHYPHSLGLFYSALTSYLGFRVNDAEWKVMGLAPYGAPAYLEKMRQLVTVYDDGSFRLNLKYFAHHYSTTQSANGAAWEALFGFPQRHPDEELRQCHHDLARSGQQLLEEIVVGLAAEAARRSGSANLVLAGGVALNSVANWRIEQAGLFKQVWVQPAAGDDGGAVGAALAVSQMALGDPRTRPLTTAYLGPDVGDDASVAEFLDREGIIGQALTDDELVDEVARLIDAGKVVGWARGRMEFGPRSLGARSILASPRSAEMKAVVNSKIKYREFFRPFAPSLPIEHVHEFFDVAPGTSLPFMLKIPTVRPEARHLIPAVTHEDGTGRVQTVDASDNPVFHRLLKRVGTLTGVPVLLNTSFNVRGEPIVCTIDDAYRCFVRTGIDALVLGRYLITDKPETGLTPAAGYAASDDLERGEQRVAGAVARFYRKLPFNVYSNAVQFASQIMAKNPVKEYRPLHRHLDRARDLQIIDVGSGGGWFANACAHYYRHEVTGIDSNPVAVRQAEDVARLLPDRSRVRFINASLFDFEPPAPVDVVNSLGVLHHTPDCLGAVRRVAGWVNPGGYLHLGLYHRQGRAPFLDHFARMKAEGADHDTLRREFARLMPGLTDDIHLESWFRDQVLHPHETQHTYEEVAPVLVEAGFEIVGASFDGYKPAPDFAKTVALEATWGRKAERALAKGRYFPGYFVIWARRSGGATNGGV